MGASSDSVGYLVLNCGGELGVWEARSRSANCASRDWADGGRERGRDGERGSWGCLMLEESCCHYGL